MVPPVVAPGLIHHPDNLALLCLDCLFEPNEEEDEEAKESKWPAKGALEWTRRFAPQFLRDYEGRLLL